jgi:transglutaminase-like putative cysteine protease
LWKYEVRGDADSTSVRVPKWAPPALGYRAAPESSVQRVRGLATRLLREAGVPERAPANDTGAWNLLAARVFARHLQSGAYRYTLDLRDVVVRDRDPVAAFLFDTRRGHCEFFASALAALCHSIDIDARVIAGYRVGAIDASTGHYRVRAADAHAWAEIRSELDRYTAIDPTPPAAIAPRVAESDRLLDRLGVVYQRLEGSWAQRVIAFDDLTQARLLASIEGGWSTWFRRQWRVLSGWAAQINRAFYLGPAGYIWMGLVAFAVGIALVAITRGVRRLRRLRSTLRTERLERNVSRRLVRQLGFYLDMLEILRATGAPKPPWQPPLAFAETLAARRAPGAAVVHELTELFYRGRYGGHALDRDELRRARDLVGHLVAERGAARS